MERTVFLYKKSWPEEWFHKPGSRSDYCASCLPRLPVEERASYLMMNCVSELGDDIEGYEIDDSSKSGGVPLVECDVCGAPLAESMSASDAPSSSACSASACSSTDC